MSTRSYRIAVIPGDGIGVEITPLAVDVLRLLEQVTGEFTAAYTEFPWGSDFYLQRGKMMPEDGLETLRDFDAILFGAVGSTQVPDHITLRGLRLQICQGFDQYANLRPTRLLPGMLSPLRDRTSSDLDFIVVRENTEGEYVGAGGRAHPGHPQETAVETAVFSRFGIERIMRYAFELARSRPKKHLISVTKSNAQQHTLLLWDEIVDEIAADYPDISTERVLVDAMAARMILKPQGLDVIVASNLFADILTDLAGAIGGSLGLAASANLNPERAYPSMFEPVHGSAFDIVGAGIANPVGTLWSAALMLDHLGAGVSAAKLMSAIERTTANSNVMTPDVGGNGATLQVIDHVCEMLQVD